MRAQGSLPHFSPNSPTSLGRAGALLVLLFFLSSCLLEKATTPSSGGPSRTSTRGGSAAKKIKNDPSTVDLGYGRILRANPIILTGNPNLSDNIDFNDLLVKEQDFITNNPKLEAACGPALAPDFRITDCFKVFKDNVSPPLLSVNGKWAFDANTNEFLEVHTFAHLGKTVTKFQEMAFEAYKLTNPLGSLGGGKYPTAISPHFYTGAAFWSETPLIVYANCNQLGDAFFSPSTNTVCLGQDPQLKFFVFSQDPDIIYHESGHALVKTMMNTRNKAAGSLVTPRVDLGILGNDEGGAINEGLADFFSYVLTNGKIHFSEWGLARFYRVSRPISENDPLHVEGINRDDDSRVSYPNYLTYDPNNPNLPVEDIHYGGMIASHLLVALTEELKTVCQMTQYGATNLVLHVLMETLSEMGDLTSKGSNNQPGGGSADRVNLTQTNANLDAVSTLWMRVVNPNNYRRFFQTYARFLNYIFSETTPTIVCPGNFNKDKIEKLWDKYGALIFKTFNDNLNGTTTGHSGTLTQVTPANRLRSTLISKDYVTFSPRSGQSNAFVFDHQEDMSGILADLKANGDITTVTTLIDSSLPYNNANGKISPGEILGIALNLFNDSNSTMGGVQVLANDWDHGKLVTSTSSALPELRPCRNFDDEFPSESEGAAPLVTGTPIPGDCEYITRTNGGDTHLSGTKEVLAPICWVQLRSSNETLWVSQEKFRESIALEKRDCLINRTGSNAHTNDCFIRVIPGADQSFFPKIDSKKTFGETFAGINGSHPLGSPHLVIMEVSPWIPPGTTFDCRFRVRFTNCDDCWHDPSLNDPTKTSEYQDDYLDFQYSGGDPFKILHLQFTVID